MTRRSGQRVAVIGAVLFAALVVLAVLQYQWIGQVSEADRERLQRGLGSAVARFSDDFNGEIERLIVILQNGPEPVSDEAALTARVEAWKSVARHPDIVKSVSLRDKDSLPEDFAPRRGRGGPGRGGPVVIAGDAGPIVMIADRHVEPWDAPYLIQIQLDGTYMKESWLPELSARDLGADYYVRVRGPQGVFYETPGAPTEMGAGDGGSAPLFVLRPGPGRGKGGPPKGKGFGGPKGFRDKGKGPPPDGPKGPPPGEPPPDGLKGGPDGPGGPPDFNSPWRAEASYTSGAMSDVVTKLRLRNLAVSFGILLLMGASILMLMRSTRRANALAEQQLEFVAGVTHELRTPLAVILSASQNLADGVASGAAQTQRYGGVIHTQTKRLSSMVEQVLRFAGLSSQHGEMQRAPVAIDEVVAEAVADSEPELAAAGCTFTQDVADALPEMQGDRAALLHCLRNLLGNAAKHAPGSAVTLRVRTDGAGLLELAVEDNGPGIAPDDFPYLFEPFYRGGRAKDDQVQGSGLGLSLVKKIVEGHGGKVEAANRVGGGAVVRMLLPLKGA